MTGGAPAEINLPPRAEGLRTRNTTNDNKMSGNKITKYNGTLNLLFPRSRIRLLRKDKRGDILSDPSLADEY
jgi:hypothetical protein